MFPVPTPPLSCHSNTPFPCSPSAQRASELASQRKDNSTVTVQTWGYTHEEFGPRHIHADPRRLMEEFREAVRRFNGERWWFAPQGCRNKIHVTVARPPHDPCHSSTEEPGLWSTTDPKPCSFMVSHAQSHKPA